MCVRVCMCVWFIEHWNNFKILYFHPDQRAEESSQRPSEIVSSKSELHLSLRRQITEQRAEFKVFWPFVQKSEGPLKPILSGKISSTSLRLCVNLTGSVLKSTLFGDNDHSLSVGIIFLPIQPEEPLSK